MLFRSHRPLTSPLLVFDLRLIYFSHVNLTVKALCAVCTPNRRALYARMGRIRYRTDGLKGKPARQVAWRWRKRWRTQFSSERQTAGMADERLVSVEDLPARRELWHGVWDWLIRECERLASESESAAVEAPDDASDLRLRRL